MEQDTARPIISEYILEKVGEEDETSQEDDYDFMSAPHRKIDNESVQKETESDHLRTEEDIIKHKIHSAVK
jgi:hypothetical protein